MHYEQETGNCDSVNYQRYCDDIDKETDEIKKLQVEVEDLKSILLEVIKVANDGLEGLYGKKKI